MNHAPAAAVNVERPPLRWAEFVALGVTSYFITLVIVVAGMSFGLDYLPRDEEAATELDRVMCNWDGVWYVGIARQGYSYDEKEASNVAFFPAFPVLGRLVASSTGLSLEWAMVLTSNICLLIAFIMIPAYVRTRYADGGANLQAWTALGFGLWPVSFFARMAYSESLFVMLVILVLFACSRKWPLVVIALLVGLATACRPVGVALIPSFYWYLWGVKTSWKSFSLNGTFLAPVACWGIIAYMIYQYFAFGDALAFMKTQENWAANADGSWLERISNSLVLRPVVAKYDPNDPAWWALNDPHVNPLFSLAFANPIYVAVICGLVIYGRWSGHLNSTEAVLAAGLLLIPYVTHADRAMFTAQGRYAFSAFPAFLIWGRILTNVPPAFSSAILAISGFFLGIYSALFVAWHYIV